MKTKSLKTDDELATAIQQDSGDRPHSELMFKDGSVVGARIGRARFEYSGYSLAITREIDHEEAEKVRVRVDHPNFPTINRYFDEEREADRFALPYREMSDTTVTEGPVTVLLDDTGKVVAELNAEGIPMPLAPQSSEKGSGGDEIPF